jgi:hypothetical protein
VRWLWIFETGVYSWLCFGRFSCSLGVDERVHFCGGSEDVEVWDIEDLESGHDGSGMAAWGYVADEVGDFLLCLDEWLEVFSFGVARAPDGNVAYEVGVDVAVVLLFLWF